MNKSELVDSIAQSVGLTKEQAAKAVNAFTESVQGALQRGDDVDWLVLVLSASKSVLLVWAVIQNWRSNPNCSQQST